MEVPEEDNLRRLFPWQSDCSFPECLREPLPRAAREQGLEWVLGKQGWPHSRHLASVHRRKDQDIGHWTSCAGPPIFFLLSTSLLPCFLSLSFALFSGRLNFIFQPDLSIFPFILSIFASVFWNSVISDICNQNFYVFFTFLSLWNNSF